MTDHDKDYRERAPLERPVKRLVQPVSRFAASEASSGILLLAAVAFALALANSSWSESYAGLRHLDFSIALGEHSVSMSLQHWVNDGLMVLFFFLLGLEIKRELLAGELRDIRQSSLVFFMACGGMLLPALVYALVISSTGTEALRGWGIPMATDTAFALGLLALLGTRAPRVLTVLLSGIAILDDIGAVLVISFFYTETIALEALASAGLCFAALCFLNVAGVRHPAAYLAGGVALWYFVLQSGVHATSAGVLAALTVPARPQLRTRGFLRRMPNITRRFARLDRSDTTILEASKQQGLAEEAGRIAQATVTPLQRWEDRLQFPVLLLIVPFFAFLNAGLSLPGDPGDWFTHPVALAAAAGLVVGKTVGVSAFAALGIRSGLCRMPEGLVPAHLLGLGMLTGIGFTMSLFVNSLAFADSPALEADAKLGILMGSLLSAALGCATLILSHRRPSS